MRRADVLAVPISLIVLGGCGQPSATTPTAGPTGSGLEPSPGVLDVSAVESQVATQLHDQVGGRWTVTCPPDQPATPATWFTCDVHDRTGLAAAVVVTLGSAGAYAWTVTRAPDPLDAQPPKASR